MQRLLLGLRRRTFYEAVPSVIACGVVTRVADEVSAAAPTAEVLT